MADQAQAENPAKVLNDKIKDIRIAMLTTQEADGKLISRPMGTQQIEFDGDLWFFTQESSPKVDQVQEHRQVNVAYAKPDDNRFVSVSGTAVIVHDKQKMQELWNPILKAWFPKGLEDPELALLKVNVTGAEYWDTPSSKVVQLVGFAKAIVTGKPASNIGENEKLDLS